MVSVGRVDLSGLAIEERNQEAGRQAASEGQLPFDLVIGPLLRVTLVTLGDQEHMLLVTMHHIISDAWSTGVMTSELTSLYKAYGAGAVSTLSDLAIQYADYAVWQHQWLAGEVLDH